MKKGMRKLGLLEFSLNYLHTRFPKIVKWAFLQISNKKLSLKPTDFRHKQKLERQTSLDTSESRKKRNGLQFVAEF